MAANINILNPKIEIETLKINQIFINPTNPRIIKDLKFKKLVKSIRDFPEMLKLRPIIVNKKGEIIGGNMRFKACQQIGLKEVPVIKAENLTDKQIQQFIIKDNVGFGEWDWDMLANDWDIIELEEWGLDGFPFEDEDEEIYTKTIKSPVYEPKNEKPNINELYEQNKTNKLLKKIQSSNVTDEEKIFLIQAAGRHTVFDYTKIADFYAHSRKEIQELMEDSALIIIDFEKAIEKGFVQMTKYLDEIQNDDE
tara:strand:- start:2102 stop:2857 length:756 start_codon:yes stop_codon:yes gene_type:complete